MTEATSLTSQPAEFLRIWSDSFSQVVGQIRGAAVPCKIEAEMSRDFPPAAEGDLWVLVTSSGALRGELSLRLPAATVLPLAQIFMSEPATPEAQPTSDHREAVVELLRQVSGIVSGSAKPRWGEVQLLVEEAAAEPPWPSAGTFWLQVGEQDPARMLEVSFSAALVAELKAGKAEATKTKLAKTESPQLAVVKKQRTPPSVSRKALALSIC